MCYKEAHRPCVAHSGGFCQVINAKVLQNETSNHLEENWTPPTSMLFHLVLLFIVHPHLLHAHTSCLGAIVRVHQDLIKFWEMSTKSEM